MVRLVLREWRQTAISTSPNLAAKCKDVFPKSSGSGLRRRSRSYGCERMMRRTRGSERRWRARRRRVLGAILYKKYVRSNSCWFAGEGTKEGRSEEVHFGGMFIAWLGQLEDMVLIEYKSL